MSSSSKTFLYRSRVSFSQSPNLLALKMRVSTFIASSLCAFLLVGVALAGMCPSIISVERVSRVVSRELDLRASAKLLLFVLTSHGE